MLKLYVYFESKVFFVRHTQFVNNFLYLFLLVCLATSSAVPLVAEVLEASPLVEPRISDVLHSPLRQDMNSVSMSWVNSHRSTLIDFPTQKEADEYNSKLFLACTMLQGPKQKDYVPKTRQALLQSLQFLGRPNQRSVLVGIDRSITRAGQFSLYSLLTQEVTDWNVIKNRQAFVKFLVSNPDVLANIQSFLKKIHATEDLAVKAMQKSIELAKDRTNKSPLDSLGMSFQSIDSFETFQTTFGSVFYSALGVAAFARAGYNIASATSYGPAVKRKVMGFTGPIFNGLHQSIKNFFSQLYKDVSRSLIYQAVHPSAIYFDGAVKALAPAFPPATPQVIDTIGACYIARLMYRVMKFRHSIFAENYAMAYAAAQMCRNALSLQEEITHLDYVHKLYNDLFPHPSAQWQNLERKMHTSTFDGDGTPKGALAQFFYTHNGRVENTIKNIHGAMNEFGELIRFYGELDAYQSIAQFYLDNQSTKNSSDENIRSCFVDFVENSQESVLHAHGFWNPLIPTDRVRPSTIILGHYQDTGSDSRNLIITGANAGGKSVNLKALIINICLAQTFGIACAESFRLTPFKKLIARLISVDDTASDKSKFLLEAEEVASILKEVMSLGPTEHAFVETDELFSGTEVGPAICLSLELCSRIAKMKNVMYVLATHYKQLTDLKRITNNVFDNFKVTVIKDPHTGKLMYPYSLTQGIGNTNVAFDIFLEQLKLQGIDDASLNEIIRDAKARQEAMEDQLEHISLAATPRQTAVA